jgi:ribosomal protein S18 acetylase RimI-like enzyme
VINYISVVPEYRGRCYVDDLLAEGTAALDDAGAEYVRAGTDTQNLPMATFRQAVYAEFAKRGEYGVRLAPIGETVG